MLLAVLPEGRDDREMLSEFVGCVNTSEAPICPGSVVLDRIVMDAMKGVHF